MSPTTHRPSAGFEGRPVFLIEQSDVEGVRREVEEVEAGESGGKEGGEEGHKEGHVESDEEDVLGGGGLSLFGQKMFQRASKDINARKQSAAYLQNLYT